jgi:hypothetical protein
LLDALQWLRDYGFTAAKVVTAFDRGRVLPLTECQLRLDEMTPKASVESSRMSSAALSTDELLRWVKGTVGKADYTAIVLMHPDQGYVSLVSLQILLSFLLPSLLPLIILLPFEGVVGLPNHLTSGPRGCCRPGGASVGCQEEEEEERCRQEADPPEEGGPQRIGEAPQGSSEGGDVVGTLS